MTSDAPEPFHEWAKWRIEKWWYTEKGQHVSIEGFARLPDDEATKEKTPITVAFS